MKKQENMIAHIEETLERQRLEQKKLTEQLDRFEKRLKEATLDGESAWFLSLVPEEKREAVERILKEEPCQT